MCLNSTSVILSKTLPFRFYIFETRKISSTVVLLLLRLITEKIIFSDEIFLKLIKHLNLYNKAKWAETGWNNSEGAF